jgi:hypothetical protein
VRRRAKKAGDAGPEEIEEGAACGEGAAPPVEQGKKKKDRGKRLCLESKEREERETLSLSYPQAFQFFYRYARRKSSPKGVSPSFGHPPNSCNVRRFCTLVWHTIWHTFALFLHKLLIMKGERAEGIEPS